MSDYRRFLSFLLIAVALLALSACGSGGTTSSDPLGGSSGGGSGNKGPVFGNQSTVTGKTGITLTADRATVDANNGQVLVTATLVTNNEPVPGVPVTFSIVAGPASIDSDLVRVNTNSNGNAITRISTNDTVALTTTNVIVRATTTIGSQVFADNISFQIVRGGGVIMFTSAAGTTPGSQTNILEEAKDEVDPADPAPLSYFSYYQAIPFKVTDSNGNPRVGVPVTLSKFSNANPTGSIVELVQPQTVTTDFAGQGIFNVIVTLIFRPVPGSSYATQVVYKAVTNDATPITAYVGGTYSLKVKTQ